MSNVNILVIEDDPGTQTVLRQVLDSEEWRLQIVPNANLALQALAAGDWTLVLANVGMTGLSGSLFTILKELALAAPMESGKGRVRVLFLVPEAGAGAVLPVLEQERLPYALKPFNLHDVLEKVSDLLLEAGAIPQSIRQVRREGLAFGKPRERGRMLVARSGTTRNTGMFANRADYSSSTEEEIAEYEKMQQQEESRRKKKNINDLGSGR